MVTNESHEPPSSDRGTAVHAGQWYLRSTADGDTHRGRLFGDGTVMADCGSAFKPLQALRNRGPALPGEPPDPEQVCLKCKRGRGE